MLSNKADIQLTIAAVYTLQILAISRAIATYNVAESTLRSRRAGKPTRRNCQPNLKKLTELEEEVIIKYILNLDLRRFSPIYIAICDIANNLLAIYGVG